MTEADQMKAVWAFGTAHSDGWQDSDNPCVRGPSKTKVWETWQKAKVKAKRWYKKEKEEYSVENFIAKIDRTIRAQAKMRREERRASKFVPPPVGLCVYLNESRWDIDDMGSHSEIKEKKQNPIKYVKPVKRLTKEEIDSIYKKTVGPRIADIKRMLK